MNDSLSNEMDRILWMYSIAVLAIAGPDYRFYGINANWPGSVHNALFFGIRESQIYRLVRDDDIRFSKQYMYERINGTISEGCQSFICINSQTTCGWMATVLQRSVYCSKTVHIHFLTGSWLMS